MERTSETSHKDRTVLERDTGELFSGLWAPYDERLFERSVDLFTKRLAVAGFDPHWFQGKRCLDAGCGGGRNTIAMARLGAEWVVGVDVGDEGLSDARRRSAGTGNVEFKFGSVLDIPLEDESIDLVWCAGVLMITGDEERALDELTRVTKIGGYLYLLVYATGGMRWPLIQWLRPLAAQIGQPAVEQAIELAGLPANKKRTFVDDLFCPRLDFYHWERLRRMLERRGFHSIDRWGPECRLDHEADLESYRADLEALATLFAADPDANTGGSEMFRTAHRAVQTTVDAIRWFEDAVNRGDMSLATAMERVIGQGHHRVLARKGG